MRLLRVWCIDYLNGANMVIDLDKVESVTQLGDKAIGITISCRIFTVSGLYTEFIDHLSQSQGVPQLNRVDVESAQGNNDESIRTK